MFSCTEQILTLVKAFFLAQFFFFLISPFLFTAQHFRWLLLIALCLLTLYLR